MNHWQLKNPLRGALLIAACLSLLSTFGCDRVDATKILAKAGLADANEDSELSTLRPSGATNSDLVGKPTMESIGPDGAQRIYYQFVDNSGRVQFVERLSDVPVAWRDQVGFVEMSVPPPLTPLEARRSWQVSSERTAQILASNAATLPAPGARRTQREDVILYFANWCGYCKQAQAHLDHEGVVYDLRNIDNIDIKSELKEKTGRTGIPVLDFSGEILRGYSAPRYDDAIRTIRG